MDPPKGSSDGEDIPSDFFDDFAKEDFIEGLSVVDEWDNDEPEKSKEDIEEQEERQKRSVGDQRRSSSEARMDDFIKPGSRRDPHKTNEAIKRDKELKVKQLIAKHLESTEDLRPPGTELDDYYEESRKVEKKEKKSEDRVQHSHQEMFDMSNKKSPKPNSRIQSKKRSLSPVKHHSPDRHEEGATRYYNRPGKYHASPGKFRGPSGRIHHGTERFHSRGERHREYGRHYESPQRYGRHMYSSRKSPSFYHHAPSRYDHRSRSPHHYSGYRKERRHPSHPRRSPSRTSRRSRSRSPRHYYERSPSRSPQQSSDYIRPHKDYISPYPRGTEPKPHYPDPTNFNPGFSIDPNISTPQYSVPQRYSYAPYTYDMNTPQPVPAPILAPGNPRLLALHSPKQLPCAANTGPNSTVVPAQAPDDPLAKLVADGILSHEDYLKLAPNKGALQQLDVHAKIDVLKRCHSAASKLDELKPSNRLIVGRVKRSDTPKAIAPNFFSPLKKKPIAEFKFTEISASAVALKNKQIIDTIVTTLDLHDLVGRPKKKLNNVKDAAVQTTSLYCDKCVIREATTVNTAGTSIDQEYFSSSTHTQVVEEDLQSSKSVFNASGSTSDGGAPLSFAHMTPAQLVSQLVARAKSLKQSDGPNDRPPNQYQGRNHYDDRRGPSSYRSNYNQYRY